MTINLLSKQRSQLPPAFSEVNYFNNEVVKLTQFPDRITVKMRRNSQSEQTFGRVFFKSYRMRGFARTGDGKERKHVKCGNVLREEMKTVMCFRKTSSYEAAEPGSPFPCRKTPRHCPFQGIISTHTLLPPGMSAWAWIFHFLLWGYGVRPNPANWPFVNKRVQPGKWLIIREKGQCFDGSFNNFN